MTDPKSQTATRPPETSGIGQMTEQNDTKRDDGHPWGYIDKGVWRQLPKLPMLNAELGPPPFTIEMSDGRVRHIVHEPAEASHE